MGPGCPERFKTTAGEPHGSRCDSHHHTRLPGDEKGLGCSLPCTTQLLGDQRGPGGPTWPCGAATSIGGLTARPLGRPHGTRVGSGERQEAGKQNKQARANSPNLPSPSPFQHAGDLAPALRFCVLHALGTVPASPSLGVPSWGTPDVGQVAKSLPATAKQVLNETRGLSTINPKPPPFPALCKPLSGQRVHRRRATICPAELCRTARSGFSVPAAVGALC